MKFHKKQLYLNSKHLTNRLCFDHKYQYIFKKCDFIILNDNIYFNIYIQ